MIQKHVFGFYMIGFFIFKMIALVHAHPTDVLTIKTSNLEGVYIVVGGDIQPPIQAMLTSHQSFTVDLKDDGQNADLIANDGIFTGFIEYDLQQNPRSKVALWMKGETIWQDQLPNVPNQSLAVKILQNGTQSSIKIDTQIQTTQQNHDIQDAKTSILQLLTAVIFWAIGAWMGSRWIPQSKRLNKTTPKSSVHDHQYLQKDQSISFLQKIQTPILWLSQDVPPEECICFTPKKLPIQLDEIPNMLKEISLHFEDVLIVIDGLEVLEPPLESENSNASLLDLCQRHPKQPIIILKS